MYQLTKKPTNNDGAPIKEFIFKIDERMIIPMVRGNMDYEEYLKWLAEGNEPLPADE